MGGVVARVCAVEYNLMAERALPWNWGVLAPKWDLAGCQGAESAGGDLWSLKVVQ